MSETNNMSGCDSKFAKRLRKLLKQPNITQQALADKLGVKRQAISSYSKGLTQPDIEKLIKIAQFFNVSTDYLIGKLEVPKTDGELQPTDIELQQLFCEYTGLTLKALKHLASLKKYIEGYQCPLSPILEHGNLTDFLEAIRMHVWNFNEKHINLENLNSDIVKALTETFNCDPEDCKEHMELLSISAINSSLMKIVNIIRYDEQND